MANWFLSSTAWTAVAAWAANHVYAAGAFVRQTSPSAGSERVFKTTSGGTSGASEPSAAGGNPWALGKGQTTTDNTVTWTEVTGQQTAQTAGAWAPFARLATMFTASTGPLFASAIAVGAGGSGYAAGNIVSVTAGTAMGDPTYAKVATVSAGAITGLTLLSGGSFSVLTATASALTAITGTGTSGTATRTSANYGFVAGDSFYVGSTHAETQVTSISLVFPGTADSPNQLICVDQTGTGTIPPVAADIKTTPTGSISMTGGAGTSITINFTAAAGLFSQGLIWNTGSGATAPTFQLLHSSGGKLVFKDSSIRLVATGAASFITGAANGAVGAVVELDNTDVQFNATSQTITKAGGHLVWKNKSANAVAGGAVPTALFSAPSSGAGSITLEGLDLSALTSGKTIIPAYVSQCVTTNAKDCKLGASVTTAGTPTQPGSRATFTRCDTSTNYRTEVYDYFGTLTTETTIVRTGGFSDGTTLASYKIVTTANAKWQTPFELPALVVWNETIGTVNVTVCGIWGGGAVPNNDDIWMNVEYLADGSSPVGSFAIGTKATILTSGSPLSSDSPSTWGGSTTKFKMTAALTVAKKGPITVYVRCGKASSTFYVDPLPVLS